MKILVKALYYFLIFFISYTMMNKLLDMRAFQVNLLKTTIFSPDLVKAVSYLVISLEMAVVLLLLLKPKIGITALFVMLVSFTAYIAYLKLIDRYEVCGCGGILNGLSFGYHFTINVVLLIATIFVNNKFFEITTNENQH